MLKQQHQLFVYLLTAADAAAISAAAFAAWLVRVQTRGEALPQSWENYFKEPQLFAVVPVCLLTLKALGLYRPRRDKLVINEVGQLAKASVLTVALTIVVLWIVGAELIVESGQTAIAPWEPGNAVFSHVDAARVQLPALALSLFAVLAAYRTVFRLLLRTVRDRGWNRREVAIIGTGRLGQIVARTLGRNSWTGLHVAYFVSHHRDTPRQHCLGIPVLGGLDDLDATLDARPVDGVYLALPQRLAGAMPDVLLLLQRFAVDVRIVPDVQPRYLPQSMAVSELEGMPILSYRECPVHGLGGVSKRALDVVGASIGLAIFCPLMVAIALAIRTTSPGRAIFKQRRVGLGGEVFKIYKFRTMRVHPRDTEEPAWTTRDDPRVTPLGRFLRRTSLDELPQLINVLQGRMSLVGPRPERPELIARFREDWRGYMLRQHAKAGITGWAQVNGLRGDTSLRKRIQYDLFYIRHWSLLFDIRILFATIFRGFLHRNAH